MSGFQARTAVDLAVSVMGLSGDYVLIKDGQSVHGDRAGWPGSAGRRSISSCSPMP